MILYAGRLYHTFVDARFTPPLAHATKVAGSTLRAAVTQAKLKINALNFQFLTLLMQLIMC